MLIADKGLSNHGIRNCMYISLKQDLVHVNFKYGISYVFF